MDYRPPGSSVHGILQARLLEWVAFSPPGDLPDPGSNTRLLHLRWQVDSLRLAPPRKPFRALERKKVKLLSRVRLFVTPWTVAYQAPLSMGFSRQEYWSGLPFPSPGDLPDPGIKPGSPTLEADALTSEPLGKPRGLSKCKSVYCTK